MTSVAFVYLSPIKSLSFQSAQTLIIKKDIGIDEDRIFAFSRGLNEVDARRIEKEPSDRELINFLTLKNSSSLNKYDFKFENQSITIFKEDKEIASYSIHEKENISKNYKNLSLIFQLQLTY